MTGITAGQEKAQPSISKTTAAKRFRCKVGGEWKQINAFSNAQQKLLGIQLARGKPIDPAHCGMTCKDHTSGSRTELQCELCGLTKPIGDFSKSSRRNGEFLCKRCTAWVETQEPDVTPAPLETGHISAEEISGQVWNEEFLHDAHFTNINFSVGDGKPRAPITGPEVLGLEDLTLRSDVDVQSLIDRSISSITSTTGSSVSQPPPHLRKKLNLAPPSSSASVTSNGSAAAAVQSVGKRLPPHLAKKAASSAASKDGSQFSDTASSASISTATTTKMAQDSENGRMSFNAWDITGKHHLAVKSVTDTYSSSASITTDDDDDDEEDDGASGWQKATHVKRPFSKVKPNGRWSKPNEPSCSKSGGESGWETPTPIKPPVMRGKGKGQWPKASECRIPQAELRQQAKAATPVARRPPVPETNKTRILFCEPDDEDEDDIYDP